LTRSLVSAAVALVCTAFEARAQRVVLTDITSASGVTFTHDNGASAHKYMPETMGSGVVFFDYDGDSDPDLFFANGVALVGDSPENRAGVLYRNDGDGRFVDVTEKSGLLHSGYGMGATAGDYDNDGDADLYVTHYGANSLFRNNGDGSFDDVSVDARVSGNVFSASATWSDLDQDGFVDLYVTNYVDWSPSNSPECSQRIGGETLRAYCLPDAFRGAPDELYRNLSDGRFEARGTSAGIARRTGKGLGVISLDFDDDGLTDLYVANDTVPNFLFRNRGGFEFEEVGLLVGVSYDADGNALAGMGVTHSDYDQDADLDLFVTNFEGESNTLYRNESNGFFTEVSLSSGVGRPSLPRLGFGALFADLDNDADDDLLVANGHVLDNAAALYGGSYAQRNQLFRNDGGRFTGSDLGEAHVSRGLAVADIDADLDLDVVFSNSGAAPTLLRNDTASRGAIRLLLVGRTSNRDGLGAIVEARVDKQVRRIETSAGTSYLSQSERIVHIAPGATGRVDSIRLRWPNGLVEERGPFTAGARVVWIEGVP